MADSALDERSIFLQAVELSSADDRASFLGEVCGGNRRLRSEVEALLQAHGGSCGWFDAPDHNPNPFDQPPIIEQPGSTIGPYKLLEQIGEGGMGTVFMAEQSQPVRRKVALKIIKPGMDTKQVIARFEAERQALALMDHPNIAKVLDAGSTEAGRPYFVMELVRGIPITDYCDREHLSIHERLELFVLVCRAVQHAHQKGIIHRDIKPTNVLVTVIDGVAVPKVIDFGVAKATGQSLTEQTFYTGFHQFVGTPLYMSPEQADLAGVDVDTRSDVYSLGVLLYELLTGTTPFDHETFRKAALDEMRRIIREEEPPRPSTRLNTLGETLSTVSARRKSAPAATEPRGTGRAGLDRDEGSGEGSSTSLRDRERLRVRPDALHDRSAGRGGPAVGVVSVLEIRPAPSGGADDGKSGDPRSAGRHRGEHVAGGPGPRFPASGRIRAGPRDPGRAASRGNR